MIDILVLFQTAFSKGSESIRQYGVAGSGINNIRNTEEAV